MVLGASSVPGHATCISFVYPMCGPPALDSNHTSDVPPRLNCRKTISRVMITDVAIGFVTDGERAATASELMRRTSGLASKVAW